MSIKASDPLLAAGKIITFLFVALFGLLLAVTLFAAVAALIGVAQEMLTGPSNAEGPPITILAIPITAFCFLFAGLFAICFYFFKLLDRIIDTVGAGDPLTLENVKRLNLMAWLILLLQIFPPLLRYVTNSIVEATAKFNPGSDLAPELLQMPAGFETTASGLVYSMLLALVLFILACVFKYGAQMREDLEGTV